MARSGYDPEEVLQEVYRKILTANRGRNPWDPGRCSFGHYVHMVCGSALKNHHRKQKRVSDREVLGASRPGDDAADGVDVSQVAVAPPDQHLGLVSMVESLGAFIEKTQPEDVVRDVILRVLIPGLVGGETRREMLERSGVSTGVLQKAVSRLRETTRVWQVEESG
jgi:DNA-directed RNA polymerase specialized sigma24 family protein